LSIRSTSDTDLMKHVKNNLHGFKFNGIAVTKIIINIILPTNNWGDGYVWYANSIIFGVSSNYAIYPNTAISIYVNTSNILLYIIIFLILLFIGLCNALHWLWTFPIVLCTYIHFAYNENYTKP